MEKREKVRIVLYPCTEFVQNDDDGGLMLEVTRDLAKYRRPFWQPPLIYEIHRVQDSLYPNGFWRNLCDIVMGTLVAYD